MDFRQGPARKAWLGALVFAGSLHHAAFAAPVPAPTCSIQPDARINMSASTFPDFLPATGGGWTPDTIKINGAPSKPTVAQGALYKWTFVGRPLGTLTDDTSPSATYTPPDVKKTEQVTLRLTVSAPNCTSSTADITLSITDANGVVVNAPPTAVAASTPSNPTENTLVTLDGSASYDPEHAPLTYTWTQTGGPAVTLVTGATSATRTFIAPNLAANTQLSFQLVVSDGSLTAADTTTVNVVWTDDPPVARLQCPTGVITVNEGDNVTLDGSASTDNDDGIASYAWQQLNGLPEIAGLAGWTTPSITFKAPALGYQNVGMVPVRLTVKDKAGATSSADCSVFIKDVTAPVFSLPSPDPVVADASSAAGANVAYLVTALDNVDGDLPPPNLTCAAPSGSLFPLDATSTVHCSATDSAGNVGTASFGVQVVDRTAPVIDPVQSIGVEATGPNGAVANYAVLSHDAVDGNQPAACSPAAGSTFPINAPGPSTTVTCGATDAHGNIAQPVVFTVDVLDTTAPTFDPATVSADITKEATSPLGATATYALPVANDLVDGTNVTVSCSPLSASTFALGSTPVTCDATDSRQNSTSGHVPATSAHFNVIVQDTTAPALSGMPTDVSLEATSAAGAAYAYDTPTATDIVDGVRPVTCLPASGTFALGNTTVTCDTADLHGNTASAQFTVTVADTTAPALDLPASLTTEATSKAGASVAFVALASDLVDGAVAPVCTAASGDTFPLGTTTVSCTATDKAGNVAHGSFDVLVHDTTAPLLTLPIVAPVEATGPKGAAVVFAVTADDTVDGSLAPACSPKSGDTFALGSTTVTCSATDAAGNTGTGTFDVAVQDTTGPVIAAHADVHVYATANSSGVLQYTLPSATDLVDGAVAVDCSPASGSTGQVGVATTVTCNAKDSHGNPAAPTSFKVYVDYNFTGFFQPVDLAPAVNSVKAGSAIPVKFSLGGNQGLSIFAANSPTSFGSSCTGTAEAAIEETVTAGASSLQYDSTTGQYIYVWKTDKAWVGTCRTLQVRFKDGSAAKVAIFKFK